MQVNLLEEIQAAAVDSATPLSDLLRKCAVLASRLGNAEFKSWVAHELNGYPDSQALPEYRILKVASQGEFCGAFGSALHNAPIPPATIPEKLRHFVEEAPMSDSVAVLESILSGDSTATFQIPWPADLTMVVGQQIYRDMNCLQASRVVSRGQLTGILDTVRNRILSFVLGIEAEAPDPGEWPSREAPISAERVSQVFLTTVSGDVGQVFAGNSDFTASQSVVRVGDFDSLAQALAGIGVSDSEIDELRAATDSDGESGSSSLGANVLAWCAKMTEKAATGALKISASVAAGVLLRWVLAYYGVTMPR